MRNDESIQTLRAVAIILIVAFHISTDPELDSSRALYDSFTYLFQNIRLPIFTIISGYLYASRPIAGGKIRSFVSGKARRILLPLFAVSSVEYLTISLAPGINSPADLADIWKIYVFPYQQYWFLQAIFLIFILIVILDSTQTKQSPGKPVRFTNWPTACSADASRDKSRKISKLSLASTFWQQCSEISSVCRTGMLYTQNEIRGQFLRPKRSLYRLLVCESGY